MHGHLQPEDDLLREFALGTSAGALLRATVEAMSDAFFVKDRQGRYVYINAAGAQMVGKPVSEILGMDDTLLFSDAQNLIEHDHEVMQGTGDINYEERLTAGGTTHIYLSTKGPIINSLGETIGLFGIARDVTESRRHEVELNRLNAHIVGLLENMRAGFFAVDNNTRVTHLNRGGERITGLRREDIVGKDAWDVFSGAVDSVFYDQYQRVRRERVAVDTEAYYPSTNQWLRAHMYPTPDGICTIFEEITERHTREVAALSEILRAMNTQVDVAAAFPTVVTQLQEITRCDFVGLALFDDNCEWAKLIALGPGLAPIGENTRLRVADIPDAAEVLAGRPVVREEISAEGPPLISNSYRLGYRSSLTLPLRGAARITGMLNIMWSRLGGANAVQVPLIAQIANAIALAVERQQLFEQVDAARERLKLLSQRLIEVQETERRHLGRELHDGIGQQLTGIKLLLTAAQRRSMDRATLGEVSHVLDDILARVRELSLDLRPPMLDDFGLLPALLWLVQRYTAQTKIEVSLSSECSERRFAPAVETAAYRIVQEALTNVTRHARVTHARVTIRCDGAKLRVYVADDGVGFDPESVFSGASGGGLTGMRERAALLGGNLIVDSTPGSGTRLTAELPFGTPTVR